MTGTILVPLFAHYRSPKPAVQAALAGGLRKSPDVHKRIASEKGVRPSGRGFPPRKIRRRYRALARPRLVCGSHLSGFSASCRRMRLRVSMPQNSVSQIPVGPGEVEDVRRACDGTGDGADRGFRPANYG